MPDRIPRKQESKPNTVAEYVPNGMPNIAKQNAGNFVGYMVKTYIGWNAKLYTKQNDRSPAGIYFKHNGRT